MGSRVQFDAISIQPMPGGFHQTAVPAFAPAPGPEFAIGATGLFAPSDYRAAVAVFGGRCVQHRALLNTGGLGVADGRVLALIAAARVDFAAAGRTGGGGQATVVQLQMLAGQDDPAALAFARVGFNRAGLADEGCGRIF